MTEIQESLATVVHQHYGSAAHVVELQLLAGGASHQAWSFDVVTGGMTTELILRRALGGKMFAAALGREQEFKMITAAYEAGVKVPKPHWFAEDIAGQPAFAMQRLSGETLGRRIVRQEQLDLARRRLPQQMATALAAIHQIDAGQVGFLPGSAAGASFASYEIERFEQELATVAEPYPALALALRWLQEYDPGATGDKVCHGDFRVGNVVVNDQGLVGVLDWEFAHIGHPLYDHAFGCIRAWRFGQDRQLFGGISDLATYLEAYNRAAGTRFTPADHYYWEVLANVKWAIATVTQARRHLSGLEPSMELASLGRMTAEIELEVLSLINPGHPRYAVI